MTTVPRLTEFLLTTVAVALALHAAQATADEIEYRDGALSVTAKNASRIELLERVGREVGFRVVVVGKVRDDNRSWAFSGLPLPKALKRLLSDTNSIVVYAKPTGDGRERDVSVVYLLGSGSSVARLETGVALEQLPDTLPSSGDAAGGDNSGDATQPPEPQEATTN
jgi:hypothetical protein